MADEVMANLDRLNTARLAGLAFGGGPARREDHAMALLLSLTGSGLIQWGSPADLDELARDCVRTVRALEAEAAEATARRQPTPAERRPRSQRPAGPEAEERIDLGEIEGYSEEERW